MTPKPSGRGGRDAPSPIRIVISRRALVAKVMLRLVAPVWLAVSSRRKAAGMTKSKYGPATIGPLAGASSCQVFSFPSRQTVMR